jgi:hypothetical protein
MEPVYTKQIIQYKFNNDISMIFRFSNVMKYDATKVITFKDKYNNLIEAFNSNFISLEHKNKYLQFHYLYNKYIISIIKIQQLWKLKKYRKYDYDYDMNMNDLSNYKENEKFIIINNKTIYTFAIKDFIKFFNSSLMKCDYLNEKPSHPCNPFTNIPFTTTQLYNFYIKCRNNNVNMGYFINQYYKLNMNITSFKFENHFKLGVNAIQNYIFYSTNETLYDEIFNMFFYFDVENIYEKYFVQNNKIIYLKEPSNASMKYKNKIVRICKILLEPYFIFLYKCNGDESLKIYYIHKLFNKIKTICIQYPYFWRIHLRSRRILPQNNNRNVIIRRNQPVHTNTTSSSMNPFGIRCDPFVEH